jgi:hypothetical protein
LEPVKLISKTAWETLSAEDRSIYLMAYIETGYAMSERRGDKQMQSDIKACVAKVGIDGVSNALKEISYEWKYPLPWSISKAFGNACEKYAH